VYHQLDEAEQAMRDKRYEEAKRLYESILQTEQKASVIQEARYGLACIALLTASDLAQYRDGLHAMQAWAANSTRESISRDPRHLLPLLEKRVQTLEALHGCREANKECRKRNEDLRHKHNATLTKLRELRGERKELRQKIRELENLYNELLDTRKDL
jgi:chromosome segregation ATPase